MRAGVVEGERIDLTPRSRNCQIIKRFISRNPFFVD